MSQKRFVGALVMAVISNLGLSSNLQAASSCKSLFEPEAPLSASRLRATETTMENGQVMVSGFTIVSSANRLSAIRPDAPEGARSIFSVETEPGFTLGRVSKLSETDIVVEYLRRPSYYERISEFSSVQVLRIEADGRFTPLQKFDAPKDQTVSLRSTFGGNGLVLETRGGLNSGDSVQVYRRTNDGKFVLDGRIDRTQYSDLGPSVLDPNTFFVATRFSYFNKEDALYRFVPGAKKPELLLQGGEKTGPSGILVNPDPKSIYRLTGDFFGRGFHGSSSLNLKDIEVFQVTPKGGAKKIGDIPLVQRTDIRRNITRTALELDSTSIAILDDHSYSSGIIGTNTNFAWYRRDLDVSIVRFNDGKLATQTLNLKSEAKFHTPDAIRLELQTLNPTELLLTGPNYVQVLRAPRAKFEIAEVIRFKGFEENPLPGDRIEVVPVSSTRFIIQDRYVIERLPDDYVSQYHVFDLVNGRYRLTSSHQLDGRRIDSTTVLTDGRLLMDVRPEGTRKEPRLKIIDL